MSSKSNKKVVIPTEVEAKAEAKRKAAAAAAAEAKSEAKKLEEVPEEKRVDNPGGEDSGDEGESTDDGLPIYPTYADGKNERKISIEAIAKTDKILGDEKAFNQLFLSDFAELLNTINGSDDLGMMAPDRTTSRVPLYMPRFLAKKCIAPSLDVSYRKAGNAGIALNAQELAALFSANYLEEIRESSRAKFALLRVFLVQAGWAINTREIVMVDHVTDASEHLKSVLKSERTRLVMLKAVAQILPYAAELVFRQTGHHFLSSMATSYEDKYLRIFRACRYPEAVDTLPSEILYYKLAHWVSPEVAYKAMKAKMSSPDVAKILPNAIMIRADTAPSGTALICTLVAVLEQWKAQGIYKRVASLRLCDLEMIEDFAAAIKASPVKYHISPHAYGLGLLSADEAKVLKRVKVEAKKICAIAQGYLDHLAGRANLASAKALVKHAEEMPTIRIRAKQYFTAVAAQAARSIADVVTAAELRNIRLGNNEQGQPLIAAP
mmetsp:Transcript_19660/g.29350  ORF Transcript_19660/g.29350 Transcript_19660/m.29350 type:complete len:493 (-) Transcript_19660:216-1694(-)